MTDISVPMNDLSRVWQRYGGRLSDAATEVLASGFWINGPQCKKFCKVFAEYVGVRECIGVANGTDALEIIFRSIIHAHASEPFDFPEVVTVANAGGYSAAAARLAGCTPVYADIDENSQLLDIGSAVAAVSDRTVAVVATHLYGGLVDVALLRRELESAGYGRIRIVEDCAQAHGLKYNGKAAGSFGDVAAFSFYPTKNLGACGDAGAVLTDDPLLAESIECFRQYGWDRKYRISAGGGRNSRLDEIQAAFLNVLLPELDAMNGRRLEVLDRYQASLPDGVHLVRSSLATVGHLAVALTPHRDKLREHLSKNGIGTDIHYPILDCDQIGWSRGTYRVGPTGLPVSRRSNTMLLTLPCFPFMKDEEIESVCAKLRSFSV